jgi:hypothetical protein
MREKPDRYRGRYSATFRGARSEAKFSRLASARGCGGDDFRRNPGHVICPKENLRKLPNRAYQLRPHRM